MREALSLQSPVSKEIVKAQAILFQLLIIPRETVQAPVYERGALSSVTSFQGDC
jgi:hypothetical protein